MRVKHKGKKNKGFARANFNRTARAISKAFREGKHPRTDRHLASMMDRLYGTNYLAEFPNKKGKR